MGQESDSLQDEPLQAESPKDQLAGVIQARGQGAVSPFYEIVSTALKEALGGNSDMLDSLVEQHPWLIEYDSDLEPGHTWLSEVRTYMDKAEEMRPYRQSRCQVDLVQGDSPSVPGVIDREIPFLRSSTDSFLPGPDVPTPLEQSAGMVVICSPDDLAKISKLTTQIHFSTPSAISLGVLRYVFNKFPNLSVVQVSPSVAKRCIGPGWREMRACYPDVTFVVGRVRGVNNADETEYQEQNYGYKADLYSALLEDPERRAIFERMIAVGMDHAILAQMYIEEAPISYQRIAEVTGLPHAYVQKRVNTFFVWAGASTKDHSIKTAARYLVPRLERLEKKAESARRDR